MLFLLLSVALPAWSATAAIRVGVDHANGTITELAAGPGGFNQIADKPEILGLWQVSVSLGNKVVEVAAEKAGAARVEIIADEDRMGTKWVWDRVVIPGTTETLRVEVKAATGVPHALSSRWELTIGKSAEVRIQQIRFPRVSSLRERPNERLAIPYAQGMLHRSPRTMLQGAAKKGARQSWASPFPMSLQCVAFYQENGPGLMASCDDPLGRRKQYALWGDGRGHVNLEMIHEPEGEAVGAREYRLPYGVCLGLYEGDWSEAVRLYRESPASQEIAKRGRLSRGETAPWLAETGLWLWNRGRSEQVLKPALALQERAQVPVSVLWHWWHSCPYDAGFPEYMPPREGADAFRKALAGAQARGIHAILYMNQRLWGTTTASWKAEGAEPYAVLNKQGKIDTTIYQKRLAAPMATMCIATPFWRNKYVGLTHEALCGLGADGIYMDQTGVQGMCYNPKHGHVTGTGYYWQEGLRMLTREIRSKSAARGAVALGGEFVGEPWIGDLDLTLTLDVSNERISAATREWERIPMFSAVYHGAALMFGSYAAAVFPPYDEKWPQEEKPARCLTLLDRKFDRQFYLEQARSFAWGLQPMLANYSEEQDRVRPELIDYVVRSVRTRQNARKYLHEGTWLRPLKMSVPAQDIDVVQVSIYADPKETRREQPKVMMGVWEARDKSVGVALASLSETSVELALPVDFSAYGFGERCEVYRIDEKGRKRVGQVKRKDAKMQMMLAPRDICVIEFSGGDSRR